ncbi:MAG: hypothetical protein KKC18_07855 [Chloroflexi bacterium]|nr:hypothetical protein [Chloroflexota bacterium]
MSKRKQWKSKKNQKRMSRKLQQRGLYVTIPLLAFALIIGGVWLFSQRQQVASAATPEEVAAEIIPQEGEPTPYGIPLSLDNTQRFIDYYEATTLTPEQEEIKRQALLPLKAPCCDDNSMATCCCPCNLAKSVWGLSSYLIVEENYGVEQVRESALQWLHFIHDDYYVMQELGNRGVDPGRYGLSYEAPCYAGYCERPFVDGGCGGMKGLKQ